MLGSSADWCLAPTPTGGFTKDVRPDWRAGRAAAHRHGVHAWRLTGAARRCRRWRSTCTSSATTSCRSIASSWIDNWFWAGQQSPASTTRLRSQPQQHDRAGQLQLRRLRLPLRLVERTEVQAVRRQRREHQDGGRPLLALPRAATLDALRRDPQAAHLLQQGAQPRTAGCCRPLRMSARAATSTSTSPAWP